MAKWENGHYNMQHESKWTLCHTIYDSPKEENEQHLFVNKSMKFTVHIAMNYCSHLVKCKLIDFVINTFQNNSR